MNIFQSVQIRVDARIRLLEVLVAVLATFAPTAFTVCRGDYNSDGGFYGGDIGVFFTAREGGL